jgi:hypothetical protein
MGKLNRRKTVNIQKCTRGELFTKKNNCKLNTLQNLFFNNSLHKEEYYETFIKNKNELEKRKFLSLLLLVSTNLSLNELINLKVEDFLRMIHEIEKKDKELKDKELKDYIIDNDFTKDELYIKVNSENVNLKVNIAFNNFFKKELYSNFISKGKTQPVLSSMVDNSKPLVATNLQKDLNEEIVELI